MSRRRLERSLYTQIGQYGMVPLWVLELCKEDPRAIQLYALLLAKWADRSTGRCWPDRHKDLVPAMGVAIATVDRAIATLKDIGALETKLKHRKDGAVIGMDFLVVQVDPRLTATDGKTDENDLPITDDSKAFDHLLTTNDRKAEASLALTNEKKEPRLPITGGGQTLTSDSHYKEQPESDNQNQEQRDLSTAAPPTRRFTLVDDYHDGFVTAFTTDPDDPATPDVVGGRDGKILKDLAEHIGEARLRRLLVHRAADGTVEAPGWFFRSDDEFIKSANSYTVPLLKACANRLNLSYRAPAQGPTTDPWAPVVERLESKVNRHTFHSWFKPITFVSRDVHGFTLRAPSRLHIDWIDKHLVTEFYGAIGEVHGTATVVRLITAEDEQDARTAIVAACVQDRERLKRTVLAQLREAYPGFESSMTQDEFVKVVRAAMVRFLIDLGHEHHEPPSRALARFLVTPEVAA